MELCLTAYLRNRLNQGYSVCAQFLQQLLQLYQVDFFPCLRLPLAILYAICDMISFSAHDSLLLTPLDPIELNW